MKLTNLRSLFQVFVLFVLINFVVDAPLKAQNQAPYQRDFTPKSPEASAFNKYGDIGVSQFTGSPNISFPLNLSEEVPISISYNASGNKPEEHHGWVGAGFNLNVGSMISRIKRRAIDEIKDINDPNEVNNKPYIHNNWRLQQQATSTWDGNEVLTKIVAYSPTTPASDTNTLYALYADLEPDEFVFNFNGFSGSFMLNHLGKWIFRGNNPSEFKIKDVTGINIQENITISLTNTLSIPHARAIMGFTIVASDGTEYYFGGDDTSVDFTYAFGPTDPAQRYKTADPMGWHLTKIKPVSGKEINFVYVKDAFSVLLSTSKVFGSWAGRYSGLDHSGSWGIPGNNLTLLN